MAKNSTPVFDRETFRKTMKEYSEEYDKLFPDKKNGSQDNKSSNQGSASGQDNDIEVDPRQYGFYAD